MYKDSEIILPCLLILFLTTFIYISCTGTMRNITGDLIEIGGSEISNDLIVSQNAEGLKNSTIQDLQNRTKQTMVLADVFATRIDEITSLLETTSSYPAVRNISYANLVSNEFMGIPESSDIEKRNVAKYLIKNESILGGVYFTLSNGDVYLGEPYSAQEQLPRINFADRDWYKGVSRTNETYISSVFISASTRAPATAIALPVYQDESSIELIGYWVGIINIGQLWKNIKDDYLPGAQELNVIDHEGTEMFNSGKYNYTEIQSAPSFYENGNVTMIYKDSATIRILEGNVVAISYPIHIRSHVWTVTTIG
ncbi:MAG TPA: PDC sensor domain-containing protein [Nitrososphaeraceae archaeon]|nr:PDC sensor domain-containing protein [Nitrososphaeraceae archaeon]